MKSFYIAFSILGLAGTANAQFLRASAFSLSNGVSQTNELPWIGASATDLVTRSASTINAGASSASSFTSGFGLLRGSSRASVVGVGPSSSQGHGLFSSFNSFIGASFFDTITLTGAGPVSLSISYSFHSVNVDPNIYTFAETEFKLDLYSTSLGNINRPKFTHSGAGERTNTDTFVVNGVAGNKFDLLGELSSLSSVRIASGDPTGFTASSDATNTALIWITPISGSFTASSGSSYAAPVPEPLTISILGLGLLGLRRRKQK